MAAHLTCPRGHHWTLPEDHPTLATGEPVACPYCGTAATLPPPGPDDPLLSDLLSRWQERFGRGEDVAAAELCRDRPELVEILAQRIEAVRALNRLVVSQNSSPNFSEQPTADGLSDTPPIPAPDAAPGRPAPALPGYVILGELGRGGMGVVYKAQQVGLNRVVALKMILAGEYAGRGELSRFQAEAEAIARLKHPHIVQIYEVGEHHGLPYFSLEFCPGGSLDKKLNGTPLPPKEAAALVEVLARAMQAAHEKGVVHRDLKPGNVLLGEGGEPKITDFGLAKKLEEAGQTHSGAVMGSPSYMAPEQARGHNKMVGPAADVYALGAILYECLTGRPPFKAATVMDTLHQVLGEEPVPPARLNPKVPRDLETVCLRCLEKEPGRRYPSAGELADELRRYQAGEPVRARPLGRWGRAVKWTRRNPVVAGLLAAVAVVMMAGTAVSMYFAIDAAGQAKLARDNANDAEAKATDAKSKEKLAKEHAAETRRVLGEFSVANGVRLEEQGDLSGALLWYAESLHRDPDNEEALTTARLRLTAYRRYTDILKPVQVFAHENAVKHAAFSPDGRRIVTASFDKTARVWDAASGQPVTPPLRHRNTVDYAAFSPDGQSVVTTGGFDFEARVWNATTGQPITPPLRHSGSVHFASFSPDGRWVLSVGGGTARVWDAVTGQPVTPHFKGKGPVLIASFSPDGRRVVTASGWRDTQDKPWGEAQVWDAATGQPLIPLLKHQHEVTYAAFSPDSRRVVTASWGSDLGSDQIPKNWGEARVWDAATGQPHSPPLRHQGLVYHAAFSPDGRRVVTASVDHTARVWDAATGQPVTPPLQHKSNVPYATFSPDGRYILTTCFDNTARVWDAATGQPTSPPLQQGGGWHAAFSPDGRRVVTASNTARIWDAAGQSASLLLQHQGPVTSAAFSPDGRRALTVSLDNTARIWDAATGRPSTLPLKHQGRINSAAFGPDGLRVLTATSDKMVRVWDTSTGRLVTPPLQHQGIVWHAKFSPDGGQVVTASEDRTARVWNAATGQPLTPPLHHQGDVNWAEFSPDGRLMLTVSSDKMVRVWDTSTGRLVTPPLQQDGILYGAEFSPDSRRVVTFSRDKTARIWDVATGSPVTPPLKHQAEVSIAAFNLNGQRLLTTSKDQTARVWNATTGQPITLPLLHQGRSSLVNAAFSSDGRRVLTTNWDTARVWDATTGHPLTPLLLHKGLSRSLHAAFSPDGRGVLTRNGDTVRIWDAATGRPLTPPLHHQGDVNWAEFSPKGWRLLTASSDKTARLWDFRPDDLPPDIWLALSQLWSGRRIDDTGAIIPLTAEEFTQAWKKLRPRYPQEFTVTAEQAFAWHRREIVDCLRERNPAAAVFHAWHTAPEFHFLWAALHP